jgi:hypothetical protein
MGKQEVLQQRHHLQIAQVGEQFVEFLLILAVQDQVGTEHEDRGGEDRQDLQGLEPQNAVPKQVNLVYLQDAHEGIDDPLEGSFDSTDAQLGQVEADLRLVHLEQVLE